MIDRGERIHTATACDRKQKMFGVIHSTILRIYTKPENFKVYTPHANVIFLYISAAEKSAVAATK
jgi:hypothetical protein